MKSLHAEVKKKTRRGLGLALLAASAWRSEILSYSRGCLARADTKSRSGCEPIGIAGMTGKVSGWAVEKPHRRDEPH